MLELTQQPGEKLSEKAYSINSFKFQNSKQVVYAIDDAFLRKKHDFLHDRVKVFARITP